MKPSLMVGFIVGVAAGANGVLVGHSLALWGSSRSLEPASISTGVGAMRVSIAANDIGELPCYTLVSGRARCDSQERGVERLIDFASVNGFSVLIVPDTFANGGLPRSSLGKVLHTKRQIRLESSLTRPVRLLVLLHEIAHMLDVEVFWPTYRFGDDVPGTPTALDAHAGARREALADAVANEVWRRYGFEFTERDLGVGFADPAWLQSHPAEAKERSAEITAMAKHLWFNVLQEDRP